MLISLNWLKQYVDIKESVEEITNTLTMIGQEVEAVNIQGKYLDNVVVGKIVEYEKHPKSDKMTLLKVDIGEGDPIQIVCGAPNHKLNDKVVVAKIGAVLPGDFKIKKAVKRGVESNGMLCSEEELGIGKAADGIIILPEDAPIGMEYRKYANIDDVIFELEITPNRPDCLSHIGIAREVAAYYRRKVKYPATSLTEVIDTTTSSFVNVQIEDKARCKRYMGRVIRNIKVTESPEWLKTRIKAMGLNPINNIVDITNFVMFEYNIPMHAFDLGKVEKNTVIVRKAEKGEKITTLDGVDRTLNNGELVIADGERPIALAGIIGGRPTAIDDSTTTVFLEVAYFEPENIRVTAKSLGITTDAAYINQRGTDIESIPDVMTRAADLISQLGHGEVLKGVIDKYDKSSANKHIEISIDLKRLNKFVGKDIEYDTIASILTSLGLTIKNVTQEKITVCPPSYRGDLSRPADIYEEVIRMYGFENIPAKIPVECIDSGSKAPAIYYGDIARKALKEIGLHEVINYSFIPSKAMDILGIKEKTIKISNPLSEDMAIVRPTLIYSLLSNIRDNLNRNLDDLRFFEVSKVFTPAEQLANEELRGCIAIAGRKDRTVWDSKPKTYDFYKLKGYLEKFFDLLGIKKYSLERSTDTKFHPGRSADIKIGKELICTFGEIHPNIAEQMDIKKEKVYVADIDISKLTKYINLKIKYERIIKYPEVSRDLAVVLDKDILIGDVIREIKKVSSIIEKVDIFDIYKGENIAPDKESIAFGIVLRDKEKTLEEKEINTVMEKVLDMISKKYHGEIRQ